MQVKGQIDFVKVPGTNHYIPVIKVADIADIKPIPAESDYE